MNTMKMYYGPTYTMKQIAYIRRHYAHKSASQLARSLGKSEGSIRNCVKRNGIRKQPHTRVLMHLPTMTVYPSTIAFARAHGINKRHLYALAVDEIRHTPAGAIRRAMAAEVEQWKQNNQTK